MESSILEPDLGPGHEVPYGAGDEDLAGPGRGHDPSTHVHCYSTNLMTAHLDFPHVDADSHLDAHGREPVDDRACTLDGRRGLSKCHEESITRGVHLPASEALQLLADEGVVRRDELAPSPVTELDGPLSRRHDVGKQDGREEPARIPGPPAPHQPTPHLQAPAFPRCPTSTAPIFTHARRDVYLGTSGLFSQLHGAPHRPSSRNQSRQQEACKHERPA